MYNMEWFVCKLLWEETSVRQMNSEVTEVAWDSTKKLKLHCECAIAHALLLFRNDTFFTFAMNSHANSGKTIYSHIPENNLAYFTVYTHKLGFKSEIRMKRK
jgi:hypothetical protein